MSKVIDFFTRKPMEPVYTKDNDDSTMEGGVYYGHVHKSQASVVRNMATLLEAKAQQLDELSKQWEELAVTYYHMIDEVLVLLEMPGYDPRTHEFQISEDGHCWLVEREEPVTVE